MRLSIWVILVLLLVGCSTQSQTLRPRRSNPTLLVDNSSLEILKIYDKGFLLGTIYSGEKRCLMLQRHNMSYRLLFWQTETRQYTPYFFPLVGDGWVVSIYHVLQNDVFSLQRARKGVLCKVGSVK